MEVFVFPLPNIVFYPSTSKPLNVFEPRYIQMVQDSLREKTPIALAFYDEAEISQNERVRLGEILPFVRPVAGYGDPMVLEKRDDDSMLVLLQSKGKVRLKETRDLSRPYLVCDAEIIPEQTQVSPKEQPQLELITRVFRNWVQAHLEDPSAREHFVKNVVNPQEIVGCFASFLVSDPDLQQLLLEMDDIDEKISMIVKVIASKGGLIG